MTTVARNSLSALRSCVSTTLVVSLAATGLFAQHSHGSEGVGTAHMEISCAPAVRARFDRALALLHNFWYARALMQFQEILQADPQCAMAYWGAAMTYNHPLWDEPSREDEAAAWAYVQKGLEARSQKDREHMYLLAAAALYKDAGAGTKRSRDEAYREQMAAAHAKYPDDETGLFYGLSIIGAISEGTKGFETQGRAVALFESVYAHDTQHPGVLHYLIHAYDDPIHAKKGLAAARAYAKTAAAVPHALHMPSHIFTRLGIGPKRRRRTRTRGRFQTTVYTQPENRESCAISIRSITSPTTTFSLAATRLRRRRSICSRHSTQRSRTSKPRPTRRTFRPATCAVGRSSRCPIACFTVTSTPSLASSSNRNRGAMCRPCRSSRPRAIS
jgi:hypothetical protein